MSLLAEFVIAVAATTAILMVISFAGAVMKRVGELLDIKIGQEDDE